jgi:hypothetical protein
VSEVRFAGMSPVATIDAHAVPGIADKTERSDLIALATLARLHSETSNSSELGRHYQQYPDEYTDADDEHGNEIYSTEPHGMSLSGASNTATITRLYCKFETAIRANRDAFAAL